MKKYIALILVCVLVLTTFSACSKKTEEPIQSEEPSSTIEPTSTPEPIRSPFTGEAISEDISDNRPYAVMINNISVAQPQVGVSNADIIYEVLAEGGITRMMAIFNDVSNIDKIGSMRSLRPYYLSIALSYDAIVVHAGGSEQAYSDVSTLGADNIDGVRGSYAEGTFFRDKTRQQYGIEHSLFATGSGIIQTVNDKGFRTTHNSSFDKTLGLLFSEEAVNQCKDKAQYVKINYNSSKATSFVYDESSELYTAYQYGSTYTDNNNTNMTFSNVIILRADTKTVDSYGRLAVNLVGSGDGYFCCGGKYIPITWHRGDTDENFTYSLQSGKTLKLAEGKSFISVVPTDSSNFGSSIEFRETYEG